MFERFEPESRRAVARAQALAARMGAEQVEPEHLLLALAEGGTPAAAALAEAGLVPATIAESIEADLAAMLEIVGVPASALGAAPALPRADLPGFGLPAKRALERALREAVRRRDRRLGTEHLLLGALRPPAPTLARVLARNDVEPERLAALVELEVAAARR